MRDIAIAYGDGIGPEIMESALEVISISGAQVRFDFIEIGKVMYERGWPSGIPPSAWTVLKRNKVLFKAPITTPQGKGYQSLNVKLRKSLGLYANIRPCVSYLGDEGIDVVVVRENSEDVYTGVEYHQVPDDYHAVKFISYSVSRRICKYAFEYAKCEGRKKVTCLVKDNIMKMTDGTFSRAFRDVATAYPEIVAEVMILDIGIARIADRPKNFDVIVTTNLYGDVVSDLVAELSGSVGMGVSLNLGNTYSMFEAIHGSAPDIAGKGVANPSGLINAAAYMLAYLGQTEASYKIYNGWRKTIADGLHTADIFVEGVSKAKLNTRDFAEAVTDNMSTGNSFYGYLACDALSKKIDLEREISPNRVLIGVDMFFYRVVNTDLLEGKLQELADRFDSDYQLLSKGLVLSPDSEVLDSGGLPDTLCCRLVLKNHFDHMRHEMVVEILSTMHDKYSLEVVSFEKLYLFDGKPGFAVFAP